MPPLTDLKFIRSTDPNRVRLCYGALVEVQPDHADVGGALGQGPGAGACCGVGGGVARVPSISSHGGY